MNFKYIFYSIVLSLILPDTIEIPEDALVSVTFERGERTATTKEIAASSIRCSDGVFSFNFNESISLTTTLFRKSSGSYQVVLLQEFHSKFLNILFLRKNRALY